MATLTRKSPAGAHKPFANYSHVVTAQGANKLVFCAGQVAADPSGKVLPPDDFAAQTKMVMENLKLALAEGGLVEDPGEGRAHLALADRRLGEAADEQVDVVDVDVALAIDGLEESQQLGLLRGCPAQVLPELRPCRVGRKARDLLGQGRGIVRGLAGLLDKAAVVADIAVGTR